METKDVVTAIFGAAVGLAGILLVFVGFVSSRAGTFDTERKRKKYENVAKVGIVPFLISLACSALCLSWMAEPSATTFCWVRLTIYASLGLTALYGLVAFVFYL